MPSDAQPLSFAVTPDGRSVLDLLGKLPGTHTLVMPTREAVNQALMYGHLTGGTTANDVETALAKRIVELLALANKSGAVVFGFEKTDSFLRAGNAVLVLQAHDAGEADKHKMDALERAVPRYRELSREELGQAVGREQVVHLALASTPLVEKILVELRRLAGFRVKNTL